MQIQGIAIDHDRQGGKRFGTNVAWQWTQGGIKILHLGGAAAPINIEQKMGVAVLRFILRFEKLHIDHQAPSH